MKLLKMCCCLFMVLSLSGCSMFRNNSSSEQSSSKTEDSSQSSSDMMQNSSSQMETSINSVQDYLDYLTSNDYTFDSIQSVDVSGFDAVEGSTFLHNGSTLYLYRFDDSDSTIKDYLDTTSQSGKMTVSRDGEELEMNALVNGYYVLLYPENYQLGDLRKVFSDYSWNQTGN